MRFAATLLVLLFSTPLVPGRAWGQARAPGFDLPMAVSVISAALGFIAPRSLDPVSVQQLALWGLSAPGSLDGTLSTELREGAVVLLQGATVIFRRPLPADEAPEAWGALAGEVLQAAWSASADIRAAGTQGAISSFFDELFNHLDPYSRYVAPEAADQDRARRSGEAGAGITVARRGGAFVVTGVNADGPGAVAGIRIGDRIVAVDGQPTAGEDLDTVQGWITGLEGTDVTLTVRTRNLAPRTVELEREVVPPETVFASRVNDVLLLRISSFAKDTDQRVASELERNLAVTGVRPGRPVRGVVIDLRGNRGGLLRQAVATVDLVLGHGLIATTAGRNPQADHTWRAGEGDLTSGRPIVVLVDGRSASAAEIVAAALGDEGRAVVVGSSTLGKGLVQTIGTMPDGGELFVSWSRVLAPGGWPLQGLGVLPQVCTSLGADQATQQLQSLERGVLPMAAALARHHAARAPLPAPDALALRGACPASEARETDLGVAQYLLGHPSAYKAALLGPPP